MAEEVLYHRLRPSQIVARRTACSAAYVPLGTLEWHGHHNPLGADGLQAEALCAEAARKGGGIAFPTLWYGENRIESLMEANDSDREDIAREMKLPPENFSAARHPFSAMEQALNYQRLLLHILTEVQSMGFKVGVLVAGHYPLYDHARAAVLIHNRSELSKKGGMLAWSCIDYHLIRDKYPFSGDHAGGWETSHLLYTHPELVDMKCLPKKGEHMVGVHGEKPPQDATAEFGRETLDHAVTIVVKEVRHRLDHTAQYRPAGESLNEGLWR
jgi:creatinine amidohydrolase